MRYLIYILVFLFLTVITQIGGVVILMCIPVLRIIDAKVKNRLKRIAFKSVSIIALYLVINVFFVPVLAKLNGRVPLPAYSNEHLKPLNILTCLFNRHYVQPELKSALEQLTVELNTKYPGIVVSYLDANFPIINGFPLIPHLSHSDGKKVDLAFFYTNKRTGKVQYGRTPSFIGYGVYVDPLPGETNMPEDCKQKGFWQYGIIERLIPQWNKDKMELNPARTRDMIIILSENKRISKLFIEPHLKKRLELNSEKIRFHGCHAVRHDDHLHVQME